jgi:hypothetical protein
MRSSSLKERILDMSTTLQTFIDVGISRHIGKYSDAVEVRRPARWLFTSGTPGLTPDGSLPETFELQAEQAWNAGAIRKAEAEFGILQVLNEDTGTLRIVAQKGFSPRFLEFFAAVHENFAACGTTLKRRERVLVNDVTTDPIFKEKSLLEIMRGEEVRSVQSLPLFTSSGCLVGVLAVHYRACDMPSISGHQLEPSYVQDVADHLHQFTRWQSGKLLERVVPIPRFDIFSGQIDKNASRIETIEGLGNAYELITKLAERSPGSYFIRDSRTHIIRGSIDTSIRPQRST